MKDQCYQFIKNQIGKVNIVGFGSYGEVKIARNTQSNQIVAIKLIHGKNAKEEIDVHHKLNHPNIIKLLNYYYEKDRNITYMVLEYAQNGSLNEKIKFGLGQLSKQLIRKYFKNICQAIKYLHMNNYMHRDIKPENILITKDNVAKLCDFGFAAIFEARTTMCGTFQYMAPQMIKQKHYNYKIDIWALGILLFQMIQGLAPFRGDTGQDVLAQMKKPIKFSQRFDSLEIDLIKKILRVNAQNRLSVEEILQHPYFKPITQDNLLKEEQLNQILNAQRKSNSKQIPQMQKSKASLLYNHAAIKTEAVTSNFTPFNQFGRSLKTKDLLSNKGEESDTKEKQSPKHPSIKVSLHSPQHQKKTLLTVNSKTEVKQNKITEFLIKPQQNQQVFQTKNWISKINFTHQNQKIKNFNQRNFQKVDQNKKISITGKSSFNFVNKSFNDLKDKQITLNAKKKFQTKTSIKTELQSQEVQDNNESIRKNVNMTKHCANKSFNLSSSRIPNQHQSQNSLYQIDQQNFDKKAQVNGECQFSSPQMIMNFQKPNIVGGMFSQKQLSMNILKQTSK